MQFGKHSHGPGVEAAVKAEPCTSYPTAQAHCGIKIRVWVPASSHAHGPMSPLFIIHSQAQARYALLLRALVSMDTQASALSDYEYPWLFHARLKPQSRLYWVRSAQRPNSESVRVRGLRRSEQSTQPPDCSSAGRSMGQVRGPSCFATARVITPIASITTVTPVESMTCRFFPSKS